MTSLRRLRAFAAVLTASAMLAGCGDDDESTGPDPDVLLSTNIILTAGVTCETGGVNKDFNGVAGKTIAMVVSGAASLTPQFTLYAPDFDTQLAFSASTGAGRAAASRALTETGTYHISVCDANGVAGNVTLVVTQQ